MMRQSQVRELILGEVRREGVIRSLFAFAVEHGLDYPNAHRCVQQLAGLRQLTVEQDAAGRGRPLVLAVGPEAVRQLDFGWPLAPANGPKVPRDA